MQHWLISNLNNRIRALPAAADETRPCYTLECNFQRRDGCRPITQRIMNSLAAAIDVNHPLVLCKRGGSWLSLVALASVLRTIRVKTFVPLIDVPSNHVSKNALVFFLFWNPLLTTAAISARTPCSILHCERLHVGQKIWMHQMNYYILLKFLYSCYELESGMEYE